MLRYTCKEYLVSYTNILSYFMIRYFTQPKFLITEINFLSSSLTSTYVMNCEYSGKDS